MPIEDRIPAMTDKELENLLANATRVMQAGGKQKAEAERLIPLVEAAMADRKVRKAEELVETKKVRQAAATEKRARKKASAARDIAEREGKGED